MVQGCSLYLHMTTSGVCKHVTVCITEFTQIVIGRLYYTEVGATAVYSAFAYLWFIILHSISCFWFIALNLTRCGVIKETIIRYFSLRLKFSGLCFFCFFFFYFMLHLCCRVLWHVLLLLLAQIRLPRAILQMCRCTHSPKLM